MQSTPACGDKGSTALMLVSDTKAPLGASHTSANLLCPPGSESVSPNSRVVSLMTRRRTALFTAGKTCTQRC
jgi:hypothetical protein